MEYTLEKDGDCIEKQYWGHLKGVFSRYEIFWSRFITPLTGRSLGRGIELQKGIDQALEKMAMAHYTVYYHLGAAYELQARLGQVFPEDILFHLSSATEMVERFIFVLAKMSGVEIWQHTEDDIVAMARIYATGDYIKKDFPRFESRGQAVNVRLHQVDDVITRFMRSISAQADQDLTEWKHIANQIRHYRNTLAHNPRLGMLLRKNELVFVPKESALGKYDLWSQVAYRSDNEDFIQLADLLANFQKILVEKTNNLWGYLIDFMEALSKTEFYARLQTGNGPTILFLDDSQEPPPESPMPSGTSSYDPTNKFVA